MRDSKDHLSMKSEPLHPDLLVYLRDHRLEKKFTKQLQFLLENFRHPSLHVEILEPKSRKIYSFRIDKRYRAIFVISQGKVVVIDVNDHYQ